MLDLLNSIIYISTALVVIAVILYAVGNKSQIVATLADKQKLQQDCHIMTFLLPKNKNKLQLKIGQQILIKVDRKQKGKQFTPIQDTVGSFKILVVPSFSVDKQENRIAQELISLNKGANIYIKIVKSNMEYVGNSQIKVNNPQKKEVFSKKFKYVYVLAQGNKISAAYQVIKGICDEKKNETKPQITVFFVGGGISDFALKKQFEHLEDNHDKIKYYYSLPVKGQRQPSIAGLGISSQKVGQTFETDVNQTFCILCAEMNDLSVTVQRSLRSKGVPSQHIYKY